MSWWEAAFLAAAGVIGGLTGSIAGLASIATYPALLVVGLPPVTANVTNTVAMVFNAIGSVWGSWPELKGQGRWLRRILPVAAVAGAIKWAKNKKGPLKLLVFLCDAGQKYVSKIFNDDWMRENGFLEEEKGLGTVKDLLAHKPPNEKVVTARTR